MKSKDFSKLSSINHNPKDKNNNENDNDSLENISQFFEQKKETAKFINDNNNDNCNKQKADSVDIFTDSLLLNNKEEKSNNIIYKEKVEEDEKLIEKENNIKIHSFLNT